ncbi:MAG: VCBS repeat-containing protein, partial [Bacteroidales bacterium]|nr:VCBS repeat-containing protein [Bacteroidales bacterium]
MQKHLHKANLFKYIIASALLAVLEIGVSFNSFSATVQFVDGLGRQLSFSKQVGSIEGGINVSSNGGAHYSIPFKMPPGINGLVPNLGIRYNSNAGNGLLGWGWNLSGIMTISRGSTSRLQEGYVKGVTQTSSDRFYLNGARLILTLGTYGSYNSEYRTEDDQGILVKYLSPGNFDVYMPNGTIYTLAQKVTGTATILWYLSKIKDLYGNEIVYTYTTPNNQLVLSTVTYAGNSIQLNYTQRLNDSNTTYVYGTPLYQKNILTDVVINADSELQYKYKFEYSEDLYKLLNVVRLYGKNGTEVNPTIINWSNADVPATKQSITSSMKYIKYYGDFNGDGRTDIISIPGNYASESGTARVSVCNSSGIGFTETDLVYGINFGGITVSDFNNDGKDEIYLLHEKEVIIASGHPPVVAYQCKFSYYYFSAGQNKLAADTSKDIIYTPSSGTKLKMVAEDFNSDGKTDYLIYNLTSHSYYAKNFSSEGGNLSVNPTFDFSTAKIIDFNGNGVPDFHAGSSVYEYYKPTGKFELIKSGLPTINYQYGAQAGDLNGDGKTDFFNVGSNYEYTIYYSDGKNVVQKPAPFSAFTSQDVDGPYESIRLMDFNGDGKADILRLYFDVSTNTVSGGWFVTPVLKGYVYYSRGDKFYGKDISNLFSDYQFNSKFYIEKPRDPDLSVDIENDFEAYEPFITLDPNLFPMMELLDFNGDGNGDIILKKPNDTSTPYEVATFSPNQRNRQVSMITNGLNVNTQIEYATLYDSEVYSTSATSYSFPVTKFTAPFYVVKKVSTLNDGSYYSSVEYDYTDAVRHREYGFLGFMKFREHHQPQNMISETTFESLGSRYQLTPKTNTVKTGSGSSMTTSSSTNLEYTVNALNNTRYYQSRVSNSTVTDHLKGFTNTTTYSSYNIQNNRPTVITESLGSDFDRTTTITYNPLTGAYWLPDRTTKTVVSQKHKDDAGYYSVTTDYTYNSGSPYKLDSKTLFSGTAKNVKETYTYHSKGGLESISRKAADVSTPRLVTYIYDANGKFIQKQKLSDYIWEEYSYDKMGRVISSKDQDNLTTTILYDDFGNHKTSTLPNGSTITSSMAFTSSGPSGSLYYTQSQQTAQGCVKKYFNRFGQVLREESPGFNQSVMKKDYTYDSKGRLYRDYIPYASSVGSYSQYSYDAYGRVTTVNMPNSLGTTTYVYTGSTTKVTTPSGWSEITVDAAGLTKQAKDAGGTVSKTFFSNGLPKTHTFGTNALTFTYDAQGNKISSTSPNTGTTSSTYNAFGELLTQTDARGVNYSMQYDNLGRITKKMVGGITETQWNYSTNGLLNSIDGIDTDISYAYDNLKRVTGITESINGQNFTTQYEFNSSSQISKITYPGSFATKPIYDTNGILTEVKRNDNNTSIWLLQDVTNYGAVEQFKYGNGLISNITYDANLRPKKMKSGSVFEWNYAFANNGNLSSRNNARLSNQSQSFSYDALNRLTSYRSGSMTYEA